MGIIKKPLPPEKIITKEKISKFSKEEINELKENYVPIEIGDDKSWWLSKEELPKYEDWDTDDNEYEEAEESDNPYNVLADRQYGNLLTDLNKLYGQNKLIAKKKNTGKEVINVKVDDDLIDFINKRYNNNKNIQYFLGKYLKN